tara:strand:+ start:228 stop:458 length:231 start_codon:yes stop_codon:yes gene_type:complete
MADTFKKSEIANPSDISWEDINVEREHQPEKITTYLTYRELEQQVEKIDSNITSLTEQKTVLEAEMLQVKTAAEAE